MAQRTEGKESLDDFPTPPWATRAFIEHVIGGRPSANGLSALEPACGRGFMSSVLEEYFATVKSSDLHDYGYGGVSNFLESDYEDKSFDWVITNPPFKLAEDFIMRGLSIARVGVAMLTRTVFIESIGRYERIFSVRPPNIFAQYAERVPMVRGRLDKTASTATGYGWLLWLSVPTNSTQMIWIPPCRKALERESDYEDQDNQMNFGLEAVSNANN